MRSVVARCLLIVGFALPLSAWAVDSDGDGVDDSIDAFPVNPDGAVDADNDGMPDILTIPVFENFENFTLAPPWSGNSSYWTTTGTGNKWLRGYIYGPGLSANISVTVATHSTISYLVQTNEILGYSNF